MRSLVIANVERIGKNPFLIAILFGDDGQRLDEICIPFRSYPHAIVKARQLGMIYKMQTVELWTSDRELYIESMKHAGIAGVIKHPSDTQSTRHSIERNAEILQDLYEIQPIEPKPKPPKWKAFFILSARKLLKLLGEQKYEI